jgi:CMP-N,N'-diacetyllegionaminic acid synthase
MKLHVLIPARGGSKGIIKKNIQKIKNKSLVEISIDFALSLKINGNIFVSSDMKEVENICKKYDKNIIFDRRPNYLSEDETLTKEVLKDLYERRNDITKRDTLLLLEPTSPLRELKTLDAALKYFKKKQLKSMVSVIKQNNLIISDSNYYLRNIFDLNISQRQRRKILYEVVGVFYLSKISNCLQKGFLHNNTYLYEISKREGIDINDKSDINLARQILGVNST